MLHFQLDLAQDTVLQMKNSIRAASTINQVTTKRIQTIPIYKWETMHHVTMNRHLGQSAERNGTQKAHLRMKQSQRVKNQVCSLRCY